jgi:hypothetical protein
MVLSLGTDTFFPGRLNRHLTVQNCTGTFNMWFEANEHELNVQKTNWYSLLLIVKHLLN